MYTFKLNNNENNDIKINTASNFLNDEFELYENL